MKYLSFLVATLYVPGLLSATVFGRWAVLVIGVPLLWRRVTEITLSHLIGVALVSWCVVGVFWSVSPLDTLGNVLHLLALAGVFCIAAENPKAVGSSLLAFGVGVSVSAAISLVQYFGWQPVQNISGSPVGLFLTKNAATEVAVPIAVWSLVKAVQTQRIGLLLLVNFSSLILFLLAQAKESVLMLAAAGYVLLLEWTKERGTVSRVLISMGVVGLLCLFLVAIATWPEESTHSLNERLAIWQLTILGWLQNPMGWGLGTYDSVFNGIGYAHNDFLQVLFETGPIGFVCLVSIFAVALWQRGMLAERAALASILASAMVWWPLQSPASGFLAALLCGYLCSPHRVVESARRNTSGARVEWKTDGAAETAIIGAGAKRLAV